MTYTFKLARRLAGIHRALPFAGVVLLLASCAPGEPLSAPLAPPSSPPPPTSPVPPASPDLTDTLVLEPRSAALRGGDTVRFRAPAATVNGNPVSGPTEWQVTGGGTIDTSGLFQARTVGTYEVRVRKGGKGGRSTVTVTATLADLTVNPSGRTLAPGAAQAYSAQARWSDNTTSTATGVSWAATGGTISSAGQYSAGSAPGTYQIIGTAQGIADTAVVTVAAPAATLTGLVLNPAAVSLVAGEVRQFTVAATWSDGTSTLPALTWTATGGAISTGGSYTAGQAPGTYQVIVRDAGGTRADTSAVTITAPTLTSLSLTPATATVTPGATRQFAVAATWNNGTTTVPALTWTATGGTISSSGLYSAGSAPGTYRVIAGATNGTLADTSIVTIPAVLVSCAVTPATVNLTSGQTQQYSVTGQRSDGTTTAVSVNWSATGGTISTSGLYTAGTVAGTYRILATVATATTIACGGDAVVSAPLPPPPPPPTTPTLAAVVVSPATATVSTAATQQFTANGRLSDGSNSSVAVTWSTNGGSVSTSGLYTAPSAAGSFRVIAVNGASGLADTSTVTVTAPPAPPPTQAPLNPDVTTNLPAGMSLVTNHNWQNAGSWYRFGGGGPGSTYTSFVSDTTAPDGDPFVLENGYNGLGDGWDPARYELGWQNAQAIFVSWIVKFSPTWDGGTSGVKWIVFQGDNNFVNIGMRRYPWAPYNGNTPGAVQLVFGALGSNATPSDYRDNPVVRFPVIAGQWYKVQLYVEMTPTPRYRMFINDVLVEDSQQRGGIRWNVSNPYIGYMLQSATWGGGNGYNAPNMNVRYARTAIWRR